MLIHDFLDVVARYLGKEVEYFQEGNNVDKLLLAANNAKRFMERGLDFEYCKLPVTVPINFTTDLDGNIDEAIGDLHDACDAYTMLSIDVKKIRSAWLTNKSLNRYPLRIWSDTAIYDRLRRKIDLNHISTHQPTIGYDSDPKLFQTGHKIFLYPSQVYVYGLSGNVPTASDIPSGVTVRLDVIRWLPRYGNGEDNSTVQTDFLLEYCSDYLLYRMITELNFFLKEDQRVSISQAKMTEAWTNVIAWNDCLIRGDENLD